MVNKRELCGDDTGGHGGAGVRTLFCLSQNSIKTCGFEGFDPNWKIKCCGGQNPGLRDCFGIDDSSQTQTLIKIFDFEGFDLFHTARKNDTRSQSDLVSFFGAVSDDKSEPNASSISAKVIVFVPSL